MKEFKFKLGSILKDRITGFTGVAVCRNEWLTNCNTYGIKSQELDKDGKPQDAQYFDEPNLILVEDNIFKEPENKTGGPVEAIRQTNR